MLFVTRCTAYHQDTKGHSAELHTIGSVAVQATLVLRSVDEMPYQVGHDYVIETTPACEGDDDECRIM